MNDYFDDDIPYEEDFDDIPIEDNCSDFEEESEHGPSEDEDCHIQDEFTAKDAFLFGTIMGLAYQEGVEDGQFQKKAEKESFEPEDIFDLDEKHKLLKTDNDLFYGLSHLAYL